METAENQIVKVKSDKRFVNETIKTINERRSVRKFKDKPVNRNIVAQLIEEGKMAPSAVNKQPWKFYVLTRKEDVNAFAKEISGAALISFVKSGIWGIIKTGKDFLHFSHGRDFFKAEDPIFHGAPVVIFITSPRDNEWADLDVGMCSQNIMLAAKSIGLDSCPVGLGKFVEYTKIYTRLNIPASEKVNLAIVIGYGDENPEIKERIKGNVVFI